MWLTVLLGGAVVILIYVYRILTRNNGFLDNCGFPVIPPSLFGSGPFLYHKINLLDLDLQRAEKYGKVFGAYILNTPWVFISDPEILKQITIKDFDHFPGHQFAPNQQKYRSLDVADGKEWSELRKNMSPVFTSGKLKGMLNLIDGALDNLINNLEKEVRSNPVIDMRPVLQALTMNAIGLTAFGVDLQSFEKPNNPIFKACKDTFTNIRASNVATSLIFNLVMGLEGIQKYMDSVPPGFKALWDYSLKIMKERELGNFKNGDFVDRLLEMKATILKNGIVTEEQLAAQGMIFFLAGFETTAHSMGILLYFLSKNPEAYDILEEEIDGLSSDKFDHGDELPYLEACIKEAMRLIPSVGRYNRKCTKDWEYNGIKIKKGTCIGVMAYVIHHNQDYWPEPEEFKPERFLRENAGNIQPCSYLTFGSGPRSCLGERFALQEIKIAMVKLLKNYHFEATEQTKMELNDGDLFMCSFKNCVLKLIPRN